MNGQLIFVGILILFELALPAQSPSLGGDLLGLGDQTLLLVKNRQARVGQFVFRGDFNQPLAYFNGLVELFLVRVGHSQSVQCVGVIGIFIERAPIGCRRLIEPVQGEELHPLIVVIFLVHGSSQLPL
jgi:hypothetical protein